jgi:hypothetical protein
MKRKCYLWTIPKLNFFILIVDMTKKMINLPCEKHKVLPSSIKN